MNRDQFREGVFRRDNHKCVICNAPAVDAHHIIERRLFSDGGYYIDNGASVCEKHHLAAESTSLSCDALREACNIINIVLPEHFYKDVEYDKWGNIICPDGERLRGELYYDESVQKILDKEVVFKKYIKYPRTYHLPTSSGGKDDKILKDYSNFVGKRVIVTAKLDGENTTMYNDHIHARSIDSGPHESRSWVKHLWSYVGYQLDENMRICGENLYAKHSIPYEELDSYFYVFSVWIDNTCLSWKETEEYAKILGLCTVPVIYDGEFDIETIKAEFRNFARDYGTQEGFVVRLADEFSFFDFKKSVAKFVSPYFREQLNLSHGHWISQKIVPNKLK